MKIAALFGLAALLPAASGPAPVRRRQSPCHCCSNDGQTRPLTIPLDRNAPPGSGDGPCCAKGCHTGGSRKRNSCQI